MTLQEKLIAERVYDLRKDDVGYRDICRRFGLTKEKACALYTYHALQIKNCRSDAPRERQPMRPETPRARAKLAAFHNRMGDLSRFTVGAG